MQFPHYSSDGIDFSSILALSWYCSFGSNTRELPCVIPYNCPFVTWYASCFPVHTPGEAGPRYRACVRSISSLPLVVRFKFTNRCLFELKKWWKLQIKSYNSKRNLKEKSQRPNSQQLAFSSWKDFRVSIFLWYSGRSSEKVRVMAHTVSAVLPQMFLPLSTSQWAEVLPVQRKTVSTKGWLPKKGFENLT
jgi:hypothetical protein